MTTKTDTKTQPSISGDAAKALAEVAGPPITRMGPNGDNLPDKPKAPAKARTRTSKGAKAKGKGGTTPAKAKAATRSSQGDGKAKREEGPKVAAADISDDAVIRVLIDHNPKKAGTWAFFMFEALRECNGKTVADYKAKLAETENLPKGYRAVPEIQLALRKRWIELGPTKAKGRSRKSK